jgi:hypothetical protein
MPPQTQTVTATMSQEASAYIEVDPVLVFITSSIVIALLSRTTAGE